MPHACECDMNGSVQYEMALSVLCCERIENGCHLSVMFSIVYDGILT